MAYRVAQADGADVGVGFCSIFVSTAAEGFRACAELNVAFDTNNSFEISLHCMN